MSLIQYDEMYEICCEMAHEEEMRVKLQKLAQVNRHHEDGKWWEDAVKEVLRDKERDVLVVQ